MWTRHPAALLAVALAAVPSGTGAVAADAKAGRQTALQCQACHGLDGMAKIPGAPHLAGQPEAYLAKAITDYKTGARKNEMMSLVVANLSETDIANLAAYYASIEVEVKPPPGPQ